MNVMKKVSIFKNRTLTVIPILLAIFILTNNCSKSSKTPTPGANEVFIANMAFDPITITVAVGTTVTWINNDTVAHTVTSDTGSSEVFDSSSISSGGGYGGGGTFPHTFSTAGTFHYHCSIHSTMAHGTVIVQ
jgi:plastocyanin